MESKLKQALKKLGITQIELSKKTDIPLQKIRHMSAGNKKITPEIADIIQSKTGVSATWLVMGIGEMFDKKGGALSQAFQDSTSSRENIQYYPSIKAQAGNGYINDNNSEIEVISLPKSIIDKKVSKNSKIDAIKVHGDSMFPTINENDIIFVLRNCDDIIDNKIYIIRYGEEIRVKRIFKRMNNKVLLRSDNNIYPDEEVEIGENGIMVLGQVIYNIADLS